jgi:hypothetical protein
MPVLLSSLIDAPAEELAGVLAVDESRCCLRDWLALVPDPRSRLGRWHLLDFVLGLAVCAFTAAGRARLSGTGENPGTLIRSPGGHMRFRSGT